VFTARYEWKCKTVIWMDLNCVYSQLKSKIHHRTGHERPDREERYSSTISLTSALERDGWLTPRPGSFIPRINPISAVQETSWAPTAGLYLCEKSRPRRNVIPDRPAGFESLYRLRYPGQICCEVRTET
jgi:hypothetical protein